MQSGVALCVYLLLLGDQRMLFCFVLFFHRNHRLGTLDFTSSDHCPAPSNFS